VQDLIPQQAYPFLLLIGVLNTLETIKWHDIADSSIVHRPNSGGTLSGSLSENFLLALPKDFISGETQGPGGRHLFLQNPALRPERCVFENFSVVIRYATEQLFLSLE
jgi:hypothetical protein